MDSILEPILTSPLMPNYLKELNAAAESEAARRKRFYKELTGEEKAEFINGEVIFQSPTTIEHTKINSRIENLMANFVRLNCPKAEVLQEKALISLTRNDYEPDLSYFSAATATEFTPKQMQFPAPDLAIEILSNSTKNRDTGIKFDDYAAHGVIEYWIVDPYEETIEQFIIGEGDKFKLHKKLRRSDKIVCRVIAGFDCPLEAFFDDNANLSELKRIIESA
ncbi:MAG: Uma2 family endonuclease [Verrucomicrobiota bacterium]